nr:MAG TPA: hypothetical protein [Caudoviricetes sp.]
MIGILNPPFFLHLLYIAQSLKTSEKITIFNTQS